MKKGKVKSLAKSQMGLNNDRLINQNKFQQRIGRNDPNESLLFRIFISFFYYERSILYKGEDFFNQYPDCYLINVDWINKCKEYYNYDKLSYTLENFAKNNSKIDFNNLEQYLDEIIDYYKTIFTFEKLNFNMRIKDIEPTQNKSYILNANIMDLIKDFLGINDEKIKPKYFIKKDKKYIYFIEDKIIIIGNISDKLIFIIFIIYILKKRSELLEKLYIENIDAKFADN